MGQGQHVPQPPLLYHPLLFSPQAQAGLLLAVTPHTGYKFFSKGRKSPVGQGSHSTSAVPKEPQRRRPSRIPSKRCCNACISYHHAAHQQLQQCRSPSRCELDGCCVALHGRQCPHPLGKQDTAEHKHTACPGVPSRLWQDYSKTLLSCIPVLCSMC